MRIPRPFIPTHRKLPALALAAALCVFCAVPARAATRLTLYTGVPTVSNAPTLFGEDDRVPVEQAAAAPYSAVCKLLITYRDGTSGEGTGFIYGDNLLATAGHVLYDRRAGRGGEAAKIEILPGAQGGERPYGSIVALPGENSEFRVPRRWREAHDWRADYGVIVLEEPFDPEILPLELGHYEDYGDAALLEMEGGLSIWGYDDGSFQLLEASGPLIEARRDDLLYRVGILPGQSGAPVLDASGVVVAIQNYGVNRRNGGRDLPWNSGARLNRRVYEFLTECRE